MTTEGASRVFAGDGRALTLDRTVESGGAGSIHRIVEIPDLVAKIYHPQIDHAISERKVAAMLSLVPDLPDIAEGGVREVQIAWPRFLLRDRQRRFVGFAMPLLDFATSVELEYVMQERQARTQGLPTGLGAKVTLAANLASLIAEFHRQGHCIVDLKPVNLRFYRRSLHIAMLDCDGCSIRGHGERFPALQVTPDYLAPEFQRQGLSDGGDQASNEESQDRFALAVVVFQLLNFGIHPFTGRPASERIPTDIPGRIARRCYAYGLRANPEMAPHPASGHTVMPTKLRQLFDRAFGAIGMARPSADDWVNQLSAYGRRSTGLLVVCRANPHHQHFAGLPCAACAREALLSRAASVVRTQPKKAPAWTPPPPAPAPFSPPLFRAMVLVQLPRGLSVPRLPPLPFALRFPRLSFALRFPRALFARLSPRSATPSFKISRWRDLAIFVLVVFPLLYFAISHWPSESPRSPISDEEPAMETVAPAATLDEVLSAARGSDKDAIPRELSRLPSRLQGPRPEECRAGAASWREKVQWTKDDPAFERASHLLAGESQPEPCEDLYFLVPTIVRTEELCQLRLYSPGAYPGIGETECQKNGVIHASVDALQRSLVDGRALYPLVWDGLAWAFLLSDDYENAQAAFVVSALLYRDMGFGERTRGSLTVLDEGWLRERGEILSARAWAKIHQWNNEPLSHEIDAKVRAPWPKAPPPTTPKQQRARN